jgi:hypothetical protein
MATALKQILTWPVGRLVSGSVSKINTADSDGAPLKVKSGPNAGQLTQEVSFGVAYSKTRLDPATGQMVTDTHWATSDWGKIMWAIGHGAWPNGQAQRADFAWKVVDGDSQIPNKKGNKPCDSEGYPGNWIVYFKSKNPPTFWDAKGLNPVPGESIKRGHFIQVAGSVDSNQSAQTAGLYVNHSMVAHSGFGPEITSGPDPKQAGFGQGPAPAGMSTTPLAGMNTGAAPAPLPATPLPTAGGAPPIPQGLPSAGVPAATPPPAAQTPVVPQPGFLNAGAAPAAPAPPAPPPAAVGPVLTAKAGAVSYAQFIAGGWTDETLRANGYMA